MCNIFLEIGFTPKNSTHISVANAFRMEFDKFLAETIVLSNGVVSKKVLESGEVVTPFTFRT